MGSGTVHSPEVGLAGSSFFRSYFQCPLLRDTIPDSPFPNCPAHGIWFAFFTHECALKSLAHSFRIYFLFLLTRVEGPQGQEPGLGAVYSYLSSSALTPKRHQQGSLQWALPFKSPLEPSLSLPLPPLSELSPLASLPSLHFSNVLSILQSGAFI